MGFYAILVEYFYAFLCIGFIKLEDMKVLKRSPDVLNNVKIGHGQLRLTMQAYFVLP